MTDVTVEVDESPEVDPTPTVVVVDPSPTDDTNVLIDLVERVTRLESRMDAAESQAVTAQVDAQIAQTSADAAVSIADTALSTADAALDTANEVAEIAVVTAEETGVIEEVIEETGPTDVLPDVSPQPTHWLYRGLDEWRGRIGGN